MTTAPRKRTPDRRPWHPAPYDTQTIHALKNLAAGKANEGQQQRAIEWIIQVCAGTYQPTFIPDSDRETAYAEGRRAVGLELVKLINLPPAAVAAIKKTEANP